MIAGFWLRPVSLSTVVPEVDRVVHTCFLAAMFSAIETYLVAFWTLCAEMAPYLLLGFLIAGLMHTVLTAAWVERHLGGSGFGQSVKASLIGIPLPLCSCGVIPLSAAIRRKGGSRGAVASFTAATPQTGVDSIFATYALMGGLFATIRVIAAFVSGVVAGVVIDRFGADRKSAPRVANHDGGSTSAEPAKKSCCSGRAATTEVRPTLADAMRFAFVTLPGDIARSMFLGLAIAALISAIIPTNYLSQLGLPAILTYAAVTLAAIPLYVCSTGSIPMGFALVAAGLSPGAAMVFLIAGPATSAATLTALGSIIGKRDTALYVLSLIAVAWLAGFTLDQTGAHLVTESVHEHHHGIALWKHIGGALLIALLLRPIVARLLPEKKSCCCATKANAEVKRADRPQ